MKYTLSSAIGPLAFLLFVSQCNCFPLIESELINEGNRFNDEFLDEPISSSLLDPIALENFELTPRLSLLLQPPVIDFHISPEDIPVDDFVGDGGIKYSKKPIAPTRIVLPPSRFLEPPTRAFGINPKKAVVDYFPPLYSPMPFVENLRTPFIDFRKLHNSERIMPYGGGNFFSQRLPSIFAPLSPPTLIGGSERTIQTRPQITSQSSEVKSKEQKKSTKTVSKVLRGDKEKEEEKEEEEEEKKFDLKKKTQEGKVPVVIPEIEEPIQMLIPPVKDFDFQVPRILSPPTREFSNSESS